MNTLCLPQSTCTLIRSATVEHPGLQLDKYSPPGDQQAQKQALDAVCRIPGNNKLLEELSARRQAWAKALPGMVAFCCQTTGSLTLHLARASALENAGICLHPIYGFAYLPGSGLKGMARAYAETVAKATPDDICAVFGNQPAEPDEAAQCAGSIVFHDAWPTSWPKLIVDIVNNHHPEYYQATNQYPPGDWENPAPVYFLAVAPPVTFSFLLSKRHPQVDNALLDLARQWLLGALYHLGAGAKTNAGYGAFAPVAPDVATALPELPLAVFETNVVLTSPAFLAGANQTCDDCELRPATLRGLLRWWWRTMHAGELDVPTLRALEAAIWGNTSAGGAVRIVVEQVGGMPSPQPYNKQSKANFNDQQKVSPYGIPNNANARKTTQGLWYLSYGMDEKKGRRYYLEPGARWKLRLICRATQFTIPQLSGVKTITATQVLEQAKAALWLLCYFGGVGSKARKGFGSLHADVLQGYNVKQCQTLAAQLRKSLGLPSQQNPAAMSLAQMLGPEEVDFTWSDVWSVLDQVGFAYQAFAKQYKHKREKKALGLPRHIGPPETDSFNPHPPVENRHASPVHIHLDRLDLDRLDVGWRVRIVAFPAAYLPDFKTSKNFLRGFLNHIQKDLQQRAALPPPAGSGASAMPVPGPSPTPAGPKPGDFVRAVLLAEKTKKGGWKARIEGDSRSGPIQNTGDVPSDKQPGDCVELILSANDPSFRWPTEAEKQRAGKTKPDAAPGGKTTPGRKGGRR